MKKYRCIIVDDHLVDRLMLVSFVQKYPIFDIIGVYESAIEALQKTSESEKDILFLDIDMPQMSGLELRKALQDVPICIFITAHPEHAAESFEIETFDFIVKPLHDKRFLATVNRIENYFDIVKKANLFDLSVFDDSFVIKQGHDQVRLRKQDVLFLEALKDYTVLVTADKKYYILMNIKNVLMQNHFSQFVRVHRSYAVQKQFIKKIGSAEIELHNGLVLPIGRTYKDILKLLI